jgi:uncharacterized Zn finger protein
METIVCPYCDADVRVSAVEADEGCCPECGSLITPSTIFGNINDSEKYVDDYEDGYDDDIKGYEDEDLDDDDDDDEI